MTLMGKSQGYSIKLSLVVEVIKSTLEDGVHMGSLRYFTISGFAAMRGNAMVSPDNVSSTADKSTQTQDEEFHPLTAQEAKAWRERHKSLSVWWVVGAQLALAALMAMLCAWFWRDISIGISLMYGALAVVIPAAMFARGLTSSAASTNATAAAMSFAVWQGIKLVLTVLLLALAPRVLNEISWPALLAGMLLTMKVYWLALAWGRPKTSEASEMILKS